MRLPRGAATVLVGLLLTGCATVVDGNGAETVSTESSAQPSPTATTGTGSSPGASFRCPNITYSSAGMSFECISNAMTVRSTTGPSGFPIRMALRVDTKSTFGMEMGAKLYAGTDTTFGSIASDIRVAQTSGGYYGPDAKYDIDGVNDITVDGHDAYSVIDTITYNLAYVRGKKTDVRTEKRWLVLVKRDDGRYSAWYASIPDIAKQYWARVPAVIASIKIND